MLFERLREQVKMYGIDPEKIEIEKERDLGKESSAGEEKELSTNEIES